ncbi:HAD family hydrolase [Streptomyces sp. NL15-2K]|uniref:HAD family hydrolase n=1 Tax=Streptomyces sp. NL15-2K TaxID=376149 RepID=UPI000F55C364|nr:MULTISPECIES: HAD-IA family hydrolase [Actinomycetes]WKX10373.1 HAD-IA family hydrolase [Kutzneria buriramensis]GCB48123.1 haloacid dehalogenase-like hydrolase [Streptomyces sp. NL15-2K]
MSEAPDEHDVLRRLLDRTQAVLFDFDGPVADLFRGISTAPVADEIKDAVRGLWGALDQTVEDCDDSHGILQRVRDMYDRRRWADPGREALEAAERIVTEHEFDAVKSAIPETYFADLVEALQDLHLRLAIVSNNADGPIMEFLKCLGLQSKFDVVEGRDPREPRHMKPHPDSVNRALTQLELSHLPSACLFIGDQLTDLEASLDAGTRFIGYTRSTERAEEMRRRGADWVVSSHEPLLRAAQAPRNVN